MTSSGPTLDQKGVAGGEGEGEGEKYVSVTHSPETKLWISKHLGGRGLACHALRPRFEARPCLSASSLRIG
ncbi:MAG: hypothetical protein QXO94_04665 [Candidatus Bathyarchaeia archaeon]